MSKTLQDRFSYHPYTLKFREKFLEYRFLQHYRIQIFNTIRLALILACGTYITFFFTDRNWDPDTDIMVSFRLRFFLFIPVFLLLFGLTYVPYLRKFPALFSFAGLITAMAGMYSTAYYMKSTPLVACTYLQLTLIYGFVLSGLRLPHALFISVVIIGSYAFGFYQIYDVSREDFIFTICAAICSQSVGLISLFLIERYKRNQFIDEIRLAEEKERTEELLLNTLPESVVNELRGRGSVEPVYFSDACVMFADFEGFTRIAEKMSPGELVDKLNYFFSGFDEIIDKYHLEKLKTIGDCYMCAGGVPTEGQGKVKDMILAAQEMLKFVDEYNLGSDSPGWVLRIGVHKGPLVAGIIGNSKFAYDIWGDTVNTASRAESTGVPGRINVTAEVYEAVKDDFDCEYRGKVPAKNKADMDIYLIGGRRSQ